MIGFDKQGKKFFIKRKVLNTKLNIFCILMLAPFRQKIGKSALRQNLF